MPDLPFSPRSSVMPQRLATRRVTPSDRWVLRLSQTTCQRVVAGAEANRSSRNRRNRLRCGYPRCCRGPCRWQRRTRRSELSCHGGCTRTRAVRRVRASSAGSGRHVPTPGCRSSRRSRRSARRLRPRRVPPDRPRRAPPALARWAHFASKSGSGLACQPVTGAMRLEIGCFLKSARLSRARCF